MGRASFTELHRQANGSLSSFSAAGAFTYQPSANFSGTDTFTVRVTDSANQAATATMTMNVGAVNDAPTASDDRFAVTAAHSRWEMGTR
jgi:hypothetical protein